MKIYHASLNLKTLLSYKKLYPQQQVNVLRSFGMLDNEMLGFCRAHRGKVSGLILDSGTWTLNNAASDVKARINLPNYRDYLLQFHGYFDHYFNFDSVFADDTDEVNYQNQLALEEAGLEPIPVVHDVHRDEIKYYIDKGYRMIALGSTQNGNQKVLECAFDQFSSAGVRVHLFGNVKFSSVANFPVWSCDTTAWAQRGKWGFIYYWNPHREPADKTDKIYMDEYLDASKKREFYYSTYEYRNELDQYLYDELRITSDDLYGQEGAYYKYLVNLHFYVKLEATITRIHQAKGFPTN